MASDLHRQLVSIFSDIFQMEIDPGIEDLSSEEIATWDSINKLRLLMELEQAFDLSLSDEEVLTLGSLRQAEDLLVRRGITQPARLEGAASE